MITPIHILVDIILFSIISLIYPTQPYFLLIMLSAHLIDLDHLWSKPIFDPNRNSFKTHFLHKQWYILLLIAIATLFFQPYMFFGIGLLSHLSLDYADAKSKNL